MNTSNTSVDFETPRKGEHTVSDGVHRLRFAWRMLPGTSRYGWTCIGYSKKGRGVRSGQWSRTVVTKFQAKLETELADRVKSKKTPPGTLDWIPEARAALRKIPSAARRA